MPTSCDVPGTWQSWDRVSLEFVPLVACLLDLQLGCENLRTATGLQPSACTIYSAKAVLPYCSLTWPDHLFLCKRKKAVLPRETSPISLIMNHWMGYSIYELLAIPICLILPRVLNCSNSLIPLLSGTCNIIEKSDPRSTLQLWSNAFSGRRSGLL